MPKIRALGLLAIALIASASTTSAANASETKQSTAMPYEYSKIKELVGRIEKYNDLGNYPLTFTIVNGDYGGWIAEELRLCKEDDCSYYANLNPFGFNNRKESEIIRQSYLYSDIQGSAYTNGTIAIPHSSFRILEGRDNFLACLLAHEISHVINHDYYEETLASVKGDFYSDSEEDKLKRAHLDRESELRADKDAILMVANSGFPKESCKKFLHFMSKSTGYVTTDDPENTHPSDEQRFAHAEKVTEEYKKPKSLKNNKPREWRYEKTNNYLLLVPTMDEKGVR